MKQKSLVNFYTIYWLNILMHKFPVNSRDYRTKQFTKLKKLIDFTYRKFEFFREFWENHDFHPEKFRSIDDLELIPVMTKQAYREFTLKEYETNPGKYESYYKIYSSGSTGIPLPIYRTWYERGYMLAKFLRGLFLNGMKYTDRIFNVTSPDNMIPYDSLIQRLGFLRRRHTHYHFTTEKMVEDFRSSQADILYGNRSHLCILADYIQENDVKIKQPKFFVCAAETIDPHSENKLKKVFGPNLLEIYGAAEFNNLAFQIKGKKFLNFNHDTNILEIVESDPGIIISDLHIHSFPLIRYKLGDILQVEKKDGIDVIRKIQGRKDDFLLTKSGRKLTFHFVFALMNDKTEVKQYRFIQKREDRILVQLVLIDPQQKSRIENEIDAGFRKMVSTEFDLDFEYYSNLPLDPSGKFRIVVSELNNLS